MAHESFENTDVAALLNKEYICIKLDREERPDIDSVYMAVCQAMTGAGGWPLTILMTPEQKPFFAGTYLPRSSRQGMFGLTELLTQAAKQWKYDRNRLLETGENLLSYLKSRQEEQDHAPDCPSVSELPQKAFLAFQKSFDPAWGGFGEAPKFPVPHNLIFLMHYSYYTGNQEALEMAETTLQQLYRGGIFDHIGGGFSRYSTDETWLVPHFEKMLYDNALLVSAYTQAYAHTHKPLYQRIATRILEYVARELTHPDGGFYCGQDADSEGDEGSYYLFTPSELETILGEADGSLFCRWFGIQKTGNFEGKNIPNLQSNPYYDMNVPAVTSLCASLLDYRAVRLPLHKDDKILTSWNALMISALAAAGFRFDEPKYIDTAIKACQFLETHLMTPEFRLHIRYREGEAAHDGQAEDYAFFSNALADLYQATLNPSYLFKAVRLAEVLVRDFWDSEYGGCYLYASASETLISRPKELYDGAIPSANSAAALLFDRLFRLTGETCWLEYSKRQLAFSVRIIQSYPAGYSQSLQALLHNLNPSAELICCTASQNHIAVLQNYLRTSCYPNLTVLAKTPANQEILTEAAPFTADYKIPEAGAVYYLCRNGSCQKPITDLEVLKQQLSAIFN